MPVINRIADFHDDLTAWRRDLHEHPELGFEEVRTSAIVAQRLREFGVDEVITGIAKTGVVGAIKGRQPGGAIGLRSDMDALPIHEATGLPYASKIPGKMHACGHDGHTAMLLGAARYLSETRNFAGTVYVIFQPAEEGFAGGRVMVEEGLFERFPMQMVFGMHNWPQLPAGHFVWRHGPVMAACSQFEIVINGKGAHAAMPHQGIDPIVIAAHIVTGLQSIVARNVDPAESGVVTVGHISGGDTFNVIPQTVHMKGTTRWFTAKVGDLYPHRERSRSHRPRRHRRPRGGRRGAGKPHGQPDHGRRRLLVHAGSQARLLHHARRRTRRGRRAGASSEIRFQRRDFGGRGKLLGDAGRAVVGGGVILQQCNANGHCTRANQPTNS